MFTTNIAAAGPIRSKKIVDVSKARDEFRFRCASKGTIRRSERALDEIYQYYDFGYFRTAIYYEMASLAASVVVNRHKGAQ
jgi:hypothetical protein